MALATGSSSSWFPPGIWCILCSALSPLGHPGATKQSPHTGGVLWQLTKDGNTSGLTILRVRTPSLTRSVLTLQEELQNAFPKHWAWDNKTIDSMEVLIFMACYYLGVFPLFHPFLSHWRKTTYFAITNTTLSAQWELESLRCISKSRPGGLRSIPEALSIQLLTLPPFPVPQLYYLG